MVPQYTKMEIPYLACIIIIFSNFHFISFLTFLLLNNIPLKGTLAMFTLYRIVKRSVAETYPVRVNRNKCSVQFQVFNLLKLEQSGPGPEQKLFRK